MTTKERMRWLEERIEALEDALLSITIGIGTARDHMRRVSRHYHESIADKIARKIPARRKKPRRKP